MNTHHKFNALSLSLFLPLSLSLSAVACVGETAGADESAEAALSTKLPIADCDTINDETKTVDGHASLFATVRNGKADRVSLAITGSDQACSMLGNDCGFPRRTSFVLPNGKLIEATYDKSTAQRAFKFTSGVKSTLTSSGSPIVSKPISSVAVTPSGEGGWELYIRSSDSSDRDVTEDMRVYLAKSCKFTNIEALNKASKTKNSAGAD
jgi:hypothetical protein